MTLDPKAREALEKDLVIDITTTGRKSAQRRRVEIWFHNLDGDLYITGLPGSRDWYANILADPRMTFHLKETVQADLPARATPISDVAEKRRIMERICSKQGTLDQLEERVSGAPLMRVTLQSV